ncbi:MAG: thioredoxin domain-containing protein [Myxococcales bacterium]|nr:thioredoxin domain-containing protein [Myxococcales bacterium]
MAPSTDNAVSAPGRGLFWSWLALSLAGLAGSVYLGVIHWQVHNLPGHVSFCAVSERMNCDTVALSPHSILWGLPLAAWGGLFYLALGALALAALRARRAGFPWGLLSLAALWAVGLSVYLFLLSELIIGSFCLVCGSLYLVNLGLLAVAAVGLRRSCGGWRLFARLRDDLGFVAGRKKVALAAMLAGALLLGGAYLGKSLLYPQRVFAGGLGDLPTGRTAEGADYLGAAQPRLVIVEFSDYECPFCNQAHEKLRQALRQSSDWIRLEHRHFPLDGACNPLLKGRSMHRSACISARAAICAGRAGKFWEMNDALFARRGGLDAGGLTVLAETLGLDAAAFRACLDDPATAGELKRDIEEGMRRRLSGTPSFVVNGKVMPSLNAVLEAVRAGAAVEKQGGEHAETGADR